MKLPILLLLNLLIILLVSCKLKEEKNTHVSGFKIPLVEPYQSPPDLVEYSSANSIYGEWFNPYVDDFSKFSFNRDGTFSYVISNGKDSVAGEWTNKGWENILLQPSKDNKNESLHSKEDLLFFKRKFRFTNGFIYEVNTDGSLSSYYFVQSKIYR